ncbi:MAG: UvrD-helicase domain-containing protein [Desulfobacterales bacterium]|nr:UvrD-helicase domain-containing protein [Desulfobacterales bacterium]
MNDIADKYQRQRALDPKTSFIVQAPAGSGKTGLLIQRYLKLLCRVNHPEEVLAITFTRKAAAEMRNRVLAAMDGAEAGPRPEKDHEAVTWELARKVGRQDADLGWKIREDPSRMRIMTIDALCAGLTRQMPVLSGFGAPGRIADEPADLYARAARNTVAELEGTGPEATAMETLVRHLDNRLDLVENLLALMLPRREQWMRHVADIRDADGLRQMLEAAMADVIKNALAQIRERFPVSCIMDLADLCGFAAQNLNQADPDSPVCAARDLSGLPGTGVGALPLWEGIAHLLLTKDGQWRKTVNKSTGFPAPSSVRDSGQKTFFEAKKRQFKNVVATLAADPELAGILDGVRRLPAAGYTNGQWTLLQALFVILKRAAGHLVAIFEHTGQVDFSEIAIRAKAALGDAREPTDLALSLDYRISHILMDEFQDTSISQFALMQQLTAGWFLGDGRSFFAVGDPMQSIYGFREAEVGLFLTAWQQGLDTHLPLEPLLLETNFRSGPGIVRWVNAAFSQVLPETADPDSGAVPYMPAAAAASGGQEEAVSVHARVYAKENKDDLNAREAKDVVECVKQALEADSQGTVAVLVRSRPHLQAIVPEMRAAGLRFSAVEIDALGNRPVISDLVSLTRAVNHPADRVAWLSVLRAPWCGLTLRDLHAIAGGDFKTPVPELIHDPDRVTALSHDGRIRLEGIRPVLEAAVERRARQSLRRRVEGAWAAMGGPAAADPADLADVEVYLDYVEARAGAEPLADMEAFEKGVMELFAQPDPGADSRLQVMTIHKAKGLEFDTVILPGLHKAPRSQDPALLLWQERAGAPFEKSLLMAPISGTGEDTDPTYQYIWRLEQERTNHEAGRLLYVAATRAKKRLHIFAAAFLDRQGNLMKPASRSLLAVLWPVVSEAFEQAAARREPPAADGPAKERGTTYPWIFRLPAHWRPPAPPGDVSVKARGVFPDLQAPDDSGLDGSEGESLLPRFDWAGMTVRHVGSVVHRWLRKICEQGPENWNAGKIAKIRPVLQKQLEFEGVGQAEIHDAVARAETALSNAIAHETGRWILSAHHRGACEYAISGFYGRELIHGIIDRTFVDESGVRWIIDYKTGTHGGGGIEAFLDREQQRYQTQMNRYAALMHQMEPGCPVRLGLYFPMIPAWRHWEDLQE